MSEAKRGCGYRKIFGLYLVADGASIYCDGLPLPLEPCSCCNFKPLKVRNLQRINGAYIQQLSLKRHTHDRITNCECHPQCQICFPDSQGIYGLMYVGREYTPQEFIREAESMGVSKRIPEIPTWLILGKTWVFLAHSEVPTGKTLDQLKSNGLQSETETQEQIFYGFMPQRIEMPVWKGELTDQQILNLEAHGVTAVFLDPTPMNKKLHRMAKGFKKYLERLTKPLPEKEDEP